MNETVHTNLNRFEGRSDANKSVISAVQVEETDRMVTKKRTDNTNFNDGWPQTEEDGDFSDM